MVRIIRRIDALVTAHAVVALGARTRFTSDRLNALTSASREAKKQSESDESNDPHPGITTLTRLSRRGQNCAWEELYSAWSGAFLRTSREFNNW
jgi:hypothetical protein